MANFNSSYFYNVLESEYNSGNIYNSKSITETIVLNEELSVPYAIKQIVDKLIFDEFNVDYSSTDFYINSKGKLLPFNLTVNYAETDLPLMPEAIDNSVTLAGTDGEMVLDTTYGSMLFNIIAVTLDNLTVEEKEKIRKNVKDKLNEVKNNTKHLSFANQEKMYDVKYSGLAEDTNYPKWVRFEIPFKSASPYSKDMFRNRVTKVGEIISKTDVPTGFILDIKNVIKDFTITINDEKMEFTYNSEIGNNANVIIDTNNSTVKYIKDGKIYNGMKYFNKVFPKLKKGKNYVNSITGLSESDFYMEWYNLYI